MRDPTNEAGVRSGLQVPEEENMQWARGSVKEGPKKKDKVNESSGISDSLSGTLDTKLRARN